MAKAPRAPKEKPPPKQRVSFTLAAPDADAVFVAGSFCDWDTTAVALTRGRDGVWKKTVWLGPGRYEYRFFVDGRWRDDPAAAERTANEFGTENDVLHVAT